MSLQWKSNAKRNASARSLARNEATGFDHSPNPVDSPLQLVALGFKLSKFGLQRSPS
jgi:hypothetical protein